MSPCMDCRTAATVAGIDPKILDNWQSDTTFPLSSWEHSGYDQQLEWDTSPDSNQDEGDVVDLGLLQGSLAGDHPDASLFGQTPDSSNPGVTSPEKFSVADTAIEGTISETVSPRTLPSSTDDNFHLDETWPHFQLLNSMAAGIPMDSPLFYPYAKDSAVPNNTVILDDPGELSHGQRFPEVHPDQYLAFQNLSQSFSFTADPLEPPANFNSDASVRGNIPLPQPATKNVHQSHGFQGSLHSLQSYWPKRLEPQLPTNITSPVPLSQDPGFVSDKRVRDAFQYKSERSSLPNNTLNLYDCPYSALGDEVPAFAERQLEDDSSWKNEPKEESPSETQSLQNATAFMISEDPQKSFSKTAPTASPAQRSSNRPQGPALQSAATVRKRRQRTSIASLDQNQPKPLQIVQEDGQGGSIASADFVSPPRGARRKGPLTIAGRANAGLRRKNKDTCVQCRLNKRKCDGSSPCDACRPTLNEQPCARACFANIVEFGTCNYISQRAINHPTLDRAGRVRIEIPSQFDLNDLLTFLSERQGRFNIRASQAWGSLYVLDLGETYKFLKSLSDYNGNSRSTFLEFIDRRIVESKDKSKNWLSCVKDCDPMNNVYSLLSQWNNMPSRASYSFVPVQAGGQERPMDIHDPEDQREILLAAQLSRIVCRMLEVEGFRKLERDFYNIKWKQISQETHLRFLGQLGHILLTLRWRVSWWKRLGDGGREPDPSKQHYVDRVDLLCRILYVYYTCVLAKLPSWSTADIPKGVWSTYADSENAVWDDFPLDPSEDGFNKWMERGRELIEKAGVPNRVSKM